MIRSTNAFGINLTAHETRRHYEMWLHLDERAFQVSRIDPPEEVSGNVARIRIDFAEARHRQIVELLFVYLRICASQSEIRIK